jgi:phospholipase/carboxylesterase
VSEDSAARAPLAERLGLPAERIRIARKPFVTQPLDLAILPTTGVAPHPTILALHGLGMRPEPFLRWFRDLLDEPWAWLVPEGPYPMERRIGGVRTIGYAWYVYEGDTPRFRATLRDSEQRVLSILPDRASAWDLDVTRVVLLGFSQGAYLAGSLGLRHAERFRGVVIAGGRVRPSWAERDLATVPRIPFLFLHGRDDDVVPIAQARAAAEEIERLGFPVRFVETGGDHIWNKEMSDALRGWLQEITGDEPHDPRIA